MEIIAALSAIAAIVKSLFDAWRSARSESATSEKAVEIVNQIRAEETADRANRVADALGARVDVSERLRDPVARAEILAADPNNRNR